MKSPPNVQELTALTNKLSPKLVETIMPADDKPDPTHNLFNALYHGRRAAVKRERRAMENQEIANSLKEKLAALRFKKQARLLAQQESPVLAFPQPTGVQSAELGLLGQIRSMMQQLRSAPARKSKKEIRRAASSKRSRRRLRRSRRMAKLRKRRSRGRPRRLSGRLTVQVSYFPFCGCWCTLFFGLENPNFVEMSC